MEIAAAGGSDVPEDSPSARRVNDAEGRTTGTGVKRTRLSSLFGESGGRGGERERDRERSLCTSLVTDDLEAADDLSFPIVMSLGDDARQ